MARCSTSGRTRSRGARIQPIRSPPQYALLAEPMVMASAAVAANGASIGPSNRSSAVVSSITGENPVPAQQPRGLRPVVAGHQPTGGVVVVGDQVRQPRRGLAQQRPPADRGPSRRR